MSVTDASVNDRYNQAVCRGSSVPTFGRVNIRVGCAAVLAGVVEVPQRAVGVLGIIWIRNCELPKIRWLRIRDLTAALILGDGLWNSHSLRQLNDLNIPDLRVAPHDASAKLRMKSTDVLDRWLYQNAVWTVRVRLRLNLYREHRADGHDCSDNGMIESSDHKTFLSIFWFSCLRSVDFTRSAPILGMQSTRLEQEG